MPDALTGATPQRLWRRELRQRVIRLWVLKAVGTTVFISVFFRAYFFVMDNPGGAVRVMPEIGLDHWVAFTPLAFPVYVSLWVYLSLPPALIGNFGGLVRYTIWVALMCVGCLVVFWAFPTRVPDFGVDWANYAGLAFLKSVDSTGNACPSLHVASAVYAACWIQRLLHAMRAPRGWAYASHFFCLAIAWSTMATLQHVALDVIAGALVGSLFGWLSLRKPGAALAPPVRPPA